MSGELVEGIDYDVDPKTGYWIFTSKFLLERGYCCKNSCRNCPYGYKKPSEHSK